MTPDMETLRRGDRKKSDNEARETMKKEHALMIAILMIFVGIYYLVNEYTVLRITQLLGAAAPPWWAVLTVALLFFAATGVEKGMPGKAGRAFYIITAIWMGTIFILFSATLAHDLFALLIDIPPRAGGIAILAGGGSLSAYAIANGMIIRTKTVKVPFGKRLRIVQLSDVHLGTVRDGPFLARIARKVNALRPDVVVITGDLVDGTAPLRADMVDALDTIKAPIFYVTGNHETYEGLMNVLPLLKTTKMRILMDESVTYKGVQFIGLRYQDNATAKKKLERMRVGEHAVLLYHLPELYETAARKGIRLELSGHTHHGQIWPFTLLVRLAHKRTGGIYTTRSAARSGDDGHPPHTSYHYVSPGTGTWGPPMRLGSSNEITLIELS